MFQVQLLQGVQQDEGGQSQKKCSKASFVRMCGKGQESRPKLVGTRLAISQLTSIS
jgi:hypothetical protein